MKKKVSNNRKAQSKKGHYLWNSSSTKEGDVLINRTQAEREDLEEFEFFQAKATSQLGLWGAYMTDSPIFSRVPARSASVFKRTAKEMQESGEVPPKVMSWAHLAKAFTAEKVNDCKNAIHFGMKTRMASKELNIPFVMAANLVEDWEKVGGKVLAEVVEMVKSGKGTTDAPKTLVARVQQVLSGSLPKVAVDSSAEEYYKAYYGPYGETLVQEVKKRVKADLAKIWLRKEGVDEATAEYWSNYYSDQGYGELMVADPKDRKKPKKAQKKTAQVDYEASPETYDAAFEVLSTPLLEVAGLDESLKRVVYNWVSSIADTVQWAEDSGTGDISALSMYSPEYKSDVQQFIDSVLTESPDSALAQLDLDDLEDQAIEAAFTAAAQNPGAGLDEESY